MIGFDYFFLHRFEDISLDNENYVSPPPSEMVFYTIRIKMSNLYFKQPWKKEKNSLQNKIHIHKSLQKTKNCE